MAQDKQKVSVPMSEFSVMELGRAPGGKFQIPEDGQIKVTGYAVSQVVPERKIRFSDRAWAALTQGRGIDICTGRNHEDAWVDSNGVVGMADIDVDGDTGKATMNGFLLGEDPFALSLAAKLQPNSPLRDHFKQSIGGLMSGLSHVYSDPVATVECGDWVWDHLLNCRAGGAVHQDTTFQMADSPDKDPIYIAAMAGCDVGDVDPGDYDLNCIDEVLFGPKPGEVLLKDNHPQIALALADIFGQDGVAVSTRPWGPLVAEGFANAEQGQFLLQGDADKPASWLLPIWEPTGELNLNAVYAIVTGLGRTDDAVKLNLAGSLEKMYRSYAPPIVSIPEPEEPDMKDKQSVVDKARKLVDEIMELASPPDDDGAGDDKSEGEETKDEPKDEPKEETKDELDFQKEIRAAIAEMIAPLVEGQKSQAEVLAELKTIVIPNEEAKTEEVDDTPDGDEKKPESKPKDEKKPDPAEEKVPDEEKKPDPDPKPMLTADDLRTMLREEIAAASAKGKGNGSLQLPISGSERSEGEEKDAKSIFSHPGTSPVATPEVQKVGE